jgi:hypothetical protein
MAWVSTDLTADQIAWAADDKPLVGVRNVLDYATSITWTSSAGVPRSDGNESRAHDGKTSLSTSPSVGAPNNHLQIVLSGAPAFDFFAVILDDDPVGNINTRIDIADDAAYTVRLESNIGNDGGSSPRGSDLTLGDSGNAAPNSYSGVVYLRAVFSNVASFTPVLRELFIGSRVQLANHPERPYDEYNRSGNTAIHEAHSGSQERYVYSKGKRNVAAQLRPTTDQKAADLESIYTLSDYGNAPLIWIQEPTTAPTDFNLMHFRDPSLQMPHVGPNERNVLLDLEEQGPHYQALE